MSFLKDKVMKPVFWVGAFGTAMLSWLLAIAVVVSVASDRQLAPFEMIVAFISAFGFAVMVVLVIWRKIKKAQSGTARF